MGEINQINVLRSHIDQWNRKMQENNIKLFVDLNANDKLLTKGNFVRGLRVKL